ncbi:MAG: hypothetical protein AVDCRST_MAG33-2193, partial [uncultured Thermomicrobiales bacterium]
PRPDRDDHRRQRGGGPTGRRPGDGVVLGAVRARGRWPADLRRRYEQPCSPADRHRGRDGRDDRCPAAL